MYINCVPIVPSTFWIYLFCFLMNPLNFAFWNNFVDFWDLLFGTPVKSFLLLCPHQYQKQTYALAYSFHLVMLGSIDLYSVYLLMIALFYMCISLYICF